MMGEGSGGASVHSVGHLAPSKASGFVGPLAFLLEHCHPEKTGRGLSAEHCSRSSTEECAAASHRVLRPDLELLRFHPAPSALSQTLPPPFPLSLWVACG